MTDPASPAPLDAAAREALLAKVRRVKTEVGKVIVGQEEIIDQVLMAIVTGGHCLMMGVPGLAKTLLVSTLSRVLDLKFKRVQFTPDLLPSDITGSDIIVDQPDGTRKFVFAEGPLFTNMLLADEINRTPPKTQAALLEAMQEHRVTVGQTSYPLPEPFFVLATQNPIEQEGTYSLPEAQQDRFMFFLHVTYPEHAEELEVMRRTTGNLRPDLEVVLHGRDLLAIQRLVRDISCPDHAAEYAIRLARLTRLDRGREGEKSVPDFVRQYVEWGAGPRAGQYLILGAKARALLDGRPHVSEDDLRAVAYPVLRHRIIVNFNAEADGVTSAAIIDRCIAALQ
jgi:MoxR-like ATPase